MKGATDETAWAPDPVNTATTDIGTTTTLTTTMAAAAAGEAATTGTETATEIGIGTERGREIETGTGTATTPTALTQDTIQTLTGLHPTACLLPPPPTPHTHLLKSLHQPFLRDWTFRAMSGAQTPPREALYLQQALINLVSTVLCPHLPHPRRLSHQPQSLQQQ